MTETIYEKAMEEVTRLKMQAEELNNAANSITVIDSLNLEESKSGIIQENIGVTAVEDILPEREAQDIHNFTKTVILQYRKSIMNKIESLIGSSPEQNQPETPPKAENVENPTCEGKYTCYPQISEEKVGQMLEDGLGIREIAAIFGKTKEEISQYISEHKPKPAVINEDFEAAVQDMISADKEKPKAAANSDAKEEKQQDARDIYEKTFGITPDNCKQMLKQGKTVTQIADVFGMEKRKAYDFMKKYKISPRSYKA